ncbi:nosL [bacterium BMS3Abin04]|nr:nosL [bacterium BMS3Abin04]
MLNNLKIFLILVTIVLFQSCQNTPEKIDYGKDICAECNMGIVERGYGAELISSKGKVYKFDSIECLANYYLKNKSKEVGSLWVTDFASNKKFIPAVNAIYIKNDKIHSPMGLNVLAVETIKEKDSIIDNYGGKVLNWKDILKLVTADGS